MGSIRYNILPTQTDIHCWQSLDLRHAAPTRLPRPIDSYSKTTSKGSIQTSHFKISKTEKQTSKQTSDNYEQHLHLRNIYKKVNGKEATFNLIWHWHSTLPVYMHHIYARWMLAAHTERILVWMKSDNNGFVYFVLKFNYSTRSNQQLHHFHISQATGLA